MKNKPRVRGPRKRVARPQRRVAPQIQKDVIATAPFSDTREDPLLNPETLSKLPAELQMQAGMYAPGRVATPFVLDGDASLLRTAVGRGNYTQNFSTTPGNPDFFIMFYPTTTIGSSGVKYIAVNPSTTLSSADFSGTGQIALADWWGTTAFADQIYQYAVEYRVIIECSEANRAGDVFIGSLPYASWNSAISGLQFQQMAHTVISAKETNVYTLTVRNHNRSIMNSNFSSAFVGNEPVGYMYFKGYSRSITTGDLTDFGYNISGRINYCWWPEGTSTLISGMTAPPVHNNKPLTAIEQKAAMALHDLNATENTASKSVISWLDKLANGVSTISQWASIGGNVVRAASVGLSAMTRFLAEDRNDLAHNWRDAICWLNWFLQRNDRYFPTEQLTPAITEALDLMEDSVIDLIDILSTQHEVFLKWNEWLSSIPRRFLSRRGISNIQYYYDGEWRNVMYLWHVWSALQAKGDTRTLGPGIMLALPNSRTQESSWIKEEEEPVKLPRSNETSVSLRARGRPS